MATKYQAKKVIKALSESGPAADPNIQGYGISTAKAQGLKDEDGYVVVVYVADMKPVEAEKAKTDKDPADTARDEDEGPSAKAEPAKSRRTTKSQAKPEPAPCDIAEYPDTVETTSRSKAVKVPVKYVETGSFGIGY